MNSSKPDSNNCLGGVFFEMLIMIVILVGILTDFSFTSMTGSKGNFNEATARVILAGVHTPVPQQIPTNLHGLILSCAKESVGREGIGTILR